MDAAGAVFVHVEALRDRSDIVPWDLATALPPISSIDCDRSPMRSRGVLLTQIGCAAAGAADLERALRACENRWDVGLELATALNAAGRSAEARPLVERALERAPHSSTAWVEWGWLLGASGDVAGARAAWERAQALHPVDPRAARLLAAAPRR
jgi:tetratricopeptide (TPR) repeat protein